MKRIGDSDTNNNNIQPGYRNGIWHRKMCHAKRKNGIRQVIEGIELQNQKKSQTIREKENYKHLGILEAETIKQAEMKEKIRKDYLR